MSDAPPLDVSASQGATPTPISTLLALLTAQVAALAPPGYTNALPGTLIEDISSTEVGGLSIIDQARVDAVNSVGPLNANPYVLLQLGQQAGIQPGATTNTSVNLVFTVTYSAAPAPGFVIAAGTTVSDGTYQYVVQDGAVTNSSGVTSQLTAVATMSGTWSVPAGSVTNIVTSVPAGYTVGVTNPEAGTPGSGPESVTDYRARVLQAEQASCTSLPATVQTLVQAVPGVVTRLVSFQVAGGGYKVIVGGGDAYQVGYAIYQSLGDGLAFLMGSTTTDRNVEVTIFENPDDYTIIFVNPPQQTVTMTVTWNTDLPNFANGGIVNQYAAPALVNYVNSVPVGQPLNELAMTAAFQAAIGAVLSIDSLSSLVFAVYINGVLTPPEAGTGLIIGNSESYFQAAPNAATVTQG